MKYRSTEIDTSTRLDKVIGTGTQRPRRRLKHRAQANAQAERPAATRTVQPSCAKSANIFRNTSRGTYKSRARYTKWLENKGWRGTEADNRVPPRGTVGEPRHIRSMNANLVSSHARNKPAESKPFDRPRGTATLQKQNTSEEKQCKRGKRSNEARMRRIEQRKKRRIASRRFYRILLETIPGDEWRPARSTHRDTRASKAGGIDENKAWGRAQWKKDLHSQNEPVKYDDETRASAPRWEYAKELKVASSNVRGMREITKREQVITYTKKSSIDLWCLQETKTPSSSIEQRDKYIFVSPTSETGGTDHHGAGFCYNRGIEKYRNRYIQHSSHLAEMEINMHGNPLVIITAYMPHGASAEIERLAAWEEMSNRIRDITHNKNVVVLGDFSAALHARKEGEEECLGPQVWGKGLAFLREKEGLLPEHMNRNILIELFREHEMRCMNTYFEKTSKQKATYRHMWATGLQGPWNTDRYSELDLCLVFRRWANSIGNVEPDNLTNVNTDHLALRFKIKQKLKALAKAEHGKELRGAKSEGEQQTR